MRIGVLALQGAFREHLMHLNKIGVEGKEVRKVEDLQGLSGLIIPGGESTTMGKLLRRNQLLMPISKAVKAGLPVWGTCAGLIVLARTVENDITHLGLMNIHAKRNAYGRQLGSFQHDGNWLQQDIPFPMVFIRAPIIASVDHDVEVLYRVNDEIVAARQEHMLVTSFHPELTDDTRIHEYFLQMCQGLY